MTVPSSEASSLLMLSKWKVRLRVRHWENPSLCISSGENFHGASSETESAIKCLKPGLNPNRSCLAFSWKTSTSSNTCAVEIMGAFRACCTVLQRPYTVALLHTNRGGQRWREKRWNQPICWQRQWTQAKGHFWGERRLTLWREFCYTQPFLSTFLSRSYTTVYDLLFLVGEAKKIEPTSDICDV